MVEEVASYYTVIPGSDFDLDIVLTKIPKRKPALDFEWTTRVTASIGTCCVAAAFVGFMAYNKYANLRKQLEKTEHDLEEQKDGAVAERREFQEQLDMREGKIRETEERRKELEDGYYRQIQKRDAMINELEVEKQEMNEKLEVALQREKDMDSVLTEAERNERQINLFKEELEKRNAQINELLLEVQSLHGENQSLEQKWADARKESELQQQLLRQRAEEQAEIVLYWQRKFEESKIEKLRKESEHQQEIQNLIEECKMWKEKCKVQEENVLKEKNRAQEQERMKEETLRNQDKYMLMALLHGIAERNFHLEHIALECGNENEENTTEKERDGKERDGKERDGKERDDDLFDYLRKTKAEQYDRAQEERNDYLKQWDDLTQVVQDVIYGDESLPESLPELRHVSSGRNSEIVGCDATHEIGLLNADRDNKTCDQSPEDQKDKDRPTRKEIQILKARIAQLENENLVLMEYLAGTLQKEFDEVSSQLEETKDRLKEAEEKALELQGKLSEAECELTQKNTLRENLDRRAVLKSEADRCIDNQDFVSALALLRFTVKHYGSDLECSVKEVRCLLSLAMIDEAQDVLDDLPKEFKETCVIKIESALVSACNLDFGKSRMLLSQVLDACPNHPRALIAEEFVQQRMLWEALPGMIYAKEYDAALENIALAMSLGCLYPWVSVDLARITGNIFCKLGKLKEACECFLYVLAVDEDQEDCRLRLGLCFLLLGRCSDAIAEFTRLEEEDEMGEYLISLTEDLERMQQYGCPYRVLGVERDVAQDEIRRAYRKSALKCHPDKNQGADKDRAHLIMLQINYANDLLSNVKTRKKYDKTRQAIEEYAAEIFENANLPEWLDDEVVDESESDWDSEYSSDSGDEYESDSEDDADVEGNSVLMECSYNSYLDTESNVDHLEEDDDSYEEMEDEEDDDSYEEMEDEEDDDSYEDWRMKRMMNGKMWRTMMKMMMLHWTLMDLTIHIVKNLKRTLVKNHKMNEISDEDSPGKI
ncbi:myosin-10-like [Macrobrachium rosenbergii]|uniref:myosin-10-like n=1 Tax=Macrobrachium rosenbergii TaxID=79674 RepID=UPI0034D606D4